MNQSQVIPWKRISVEAAAIVASILLAFAIDAWWDDRQERSRVTDTLGSLERALSNNLDLIDENVELARASKEIVQAFVQMTPEEVGKIPSADRSRTLVALFRPYTLEINNSYIVETLNSNSLESLTDASLQEAMARWRAALDDLNDMRYSLNDKQDIALQALAKHEEVRIGFAQDSQFRTVLSADAMRRLREDPEIHAIASLKALRDRLHVGNLNTLRTETVTLLSLLREKQKIVQ